MSNFERLNDDEVMELSDFFKVFGDSTRLKIIAELFDEELSVSEIANRVGMSHSATSHQLRVLKASRLVNYRRDGKETLYTLDDEHVRSIYHQGLEHISHD